MKEKEKNYFSNKSKLILTFIMILLIILVSGYFYYDFETTSIRERRYEELEAIAQLKTNQLTQWFAERLGDASIIHKSRFFNSGIELWVKDTSKNKDVESAIKERLATIQKEFKYQAILLTDTSGNILLNVGELIQKLDSYIRKRMEEDKNSGNIFNTDFYQCSECNSIHYDIIIPIFNKTGNTIAYITIQISPQNYLYPLISTWPVPSKTAETVILRKEGDSIVYLNELKHKKNTALKLKFPLSKLEIPGVEAALGKTGIFEGKDYRGENVIAYLNSVPNTNWFMVTKIDEDEILSDLRFISALILILLFFLICSSFLIFLGYYYFQQKQIFKELFDKERRINEVQEEFRTILYSIGDGVITTDIEGKIRQMNREAERLTGWTESDAKNRNLNEVFKIFSEYNHDPVENTVEQVLAIGSVIDLTNHTLLISGEGREIPITDTCAPIKDDNGNISGVVLVFIDKTDEYLYEKKLQESEKKYRQIVEMANEGIWIMNAEHITSFVNKRIAELLGYPEEEIIGKKVEEFMFNVDLLDHKNMMEIRHKGVSTNYQRRFKRKDGSEIWTLVSGTALMDENGNFIGSFGMFSDLTEIKKTQKILLETERRFRYTLENVKLISVVLDIDGNITFVNEFLLNITGWQKEEIIGKNWFDTFLPKDNLSLVKSEFLKIKTNQEHISYFENEIVTKSGERKYIQWSNTILFDLDRIVEGVASIGIDVTELKKNFEELKLAKEKAEEINRLKSSFLAAMSHELRTPLNGILGLSELLKDKELPDNTVRMADLIHRSGMRLLSTLNMILDLSRVEAGAKKVHETLTDVNKVVNETFELYKAESERKKIYLNHIPYSEGLKVLTDSSILHDILNNLVNNALKFTDVGSVEIRTNVIDDFITIDVIDTGIGIEEKNFELVFNEFRQVSEGYGRSFEGTGLGLSISRKYANLLGGSLTLTSKIGEGSDFKLKIPKKEAKISFNEKKLTFEKKGKPDEIIFNSWKQKPKILYVEDDEVSIELLQLVLKDICELDIVKTGSEALQKAEKYDYPMILMDINLGKGMDGVEITKIIRKMPKYNSIPIIAITAFALKGDKEEFLKEGCSHYISKPFHKSEIFNLVFKLLKS